MAHFFIDRPVFAWVIAILIMLAGGLSILNLPVAQYPRIAPTAVRITAQYPGASAKTMEDTVTQVIEQKMKGLDHLQYMSSTSESGRATITLTFDADTDPDTAQVQVQNKLSLATAMLPDDVQRQGIEVTKAAHNFMAVVSFVSTDGSMDAADLNDYVATYVTEPLSRTEGVGEVTQFGAQYAMRIWLDPEKLHNFSLTPADVKSAIEAQNTQVAAGQIGGTPALPGQMMSFTINSQTRLEDVEQFKDILLRVNPDGSTVRLKDVARCEIGCEDYDHAGRYNGQPSAGVALRLGIGANALDTIQAVGKKLAQLSQTFPKGMTYVYPYDTTPFIRISLHEVVMTLLEAVGLVVLVMFLFLQNARATIIPAIAVPVVLLGTFGALAAFGFSINTLTMFGIVLAIGLLVDDAIVVVENVERIMREEGLSPRDATRKSMGQITGALVGIAMVLCAVFVPMAFMGGSTGVIYRQFALTIVAAMTLSVVVAIVLTPALCATMLRPLKEGHGESRKGFFGLFNRTYDAGSRAYHSTVRYMIFRVGRVLVVYALLLAALAVVFPRLPGGFLPEEDQGIVFATIQLPPGASKENTEKVLAQVEHYFLEDEKAAVKHMMGIVGFSFAGSGQNVSVCFIQLKDWSQRKDPALRAKAVAGRAMRNLSKIKGAVIYSFIPPAVTELGTVSGFDMYLEDRAGQGHAQLIAARNQLLALAAKDPRLHMVRPNGMEDTPQYQIDVDQAKAGALSLNLADVNDVLSTALGGSYVNDFNHRGRVKKVMVQGDAPFRMMPEDFTQWWARNGLNQMVPFSAFAAGRWAYGSPRLERYNGLSALNIQGQAAPGLSTGEAMSAMEELAAKLPKGFGIEWTGVSFQERLAGGKAPILYALSILVVFLCLAALYESWSVPTSVILVVPLGVLGAALSTLTRGLANDVYFQVGLLTTMGLSAKNAILIVEFAREQLLHGKSLTEAALEAARIRLRPILMTSLAFMLGVLPLALNRGAGSGSQNAIGTCVLGGTLFGTALAVFFVPVFFVVIIGLSRKGVRQ